MKATKIFSEEIVDLKVASLPTRPTSPQSLGGRGYSSEQMKAAFDKLPLFIVERYNALIDDIKAIGDDSVAGEIKTGIKDRHSLRELFADITSGELAGYLAVLDKTLAVHIAEINERLQALEERIK